MTQLLSVWNALTIGRKVVVVLATLAVFASVLAIGRLASQPSLSLLYAGLEPQAAAGVISALDAQGVTYEVRGDAVYVDATQRDALRLSLAGEGVPAGGAQGYELLDSLTGFGTTSQMFDAAYWRAKEGELARTIAANPQVRTARVHIANPASRPFRRDQAPSASVTVTPSGGMLSAGQARAIRYLVASAVAGLAPENVTVIDVNGGLIGAEEPGGAATLTGDDRALVLKERVQRLLEARVGAGNAIVEVSLDTVTDSEQIVERTIDPDSRVAISTETTETTSRTNDTRSGAVTVASNLPDGDAAAGNGEASSSNSETRELTNFEVSEVQREVTRAPGAIRRMTVAVLIDGVRVPGEDGSTTWSARDADELEALRALVASAVGFDESRGDEITIQSLEFEPVPDAGSEPPPPGVLGAAALDWMSIIQLGTLALVALILGLFVVRPILLSGGAPQLPKPAGELAPPPSSSAPPPLPVLDGEIQSGGGFSDLPDLPDLADLPDLSPAGSGAVDRLKQMIADREDETAEILRSWVGEPNGAAR